MSALTIGKAKKSIKCVVAFIMAAALCFVVLPDNAGVTAASGKSVSDLKKEYANMEDDLKQLQKELQKLENQEESYINQISNYNSQIDLVEDQIDSVNEQLKLLGASIEEMDADIDRLGEEIEGLKEDIAESYEQFKERLKIMYTTGEANELEILLGSASFADFLNRYAIVKAVAARDKMLMDEISDNIEDQQERLAQVEATKTAREQDKLEAEQLKKTLVSKQKELENMRTQAKAVLKKIQSDENAKQKAIEEIDKSLEKLEEEIEKAMKNSKGQYVGGTFLWPVPDYTRISSPFGYRTHPITGQYKLHKGVDIAAPKNASILAANDGTVATVVNGSTGYGKYVIVDHGGGYLTLYAHCNSISVKAGSKVKKGQEIAKVGMTGSATGYHLHFEVRINGEVVDPMGFFTLKK